MNEHKYINLVKQGTLKIDRTLTVGQAFNSYKYFKDVKWSTYVTKRGRRVVCATCKFSKIPRFLRRWDLNLSDKTVEEITGSFLFTVYRNSNSFNFYYWSMTCKMRNGGKKINRIIVYHFHQMNQDLRFFQIFIIIFPWM